MPSSSGVLQFVMTAKQARFRAAEMAATGREGTIATVGLYAPHLAFGGQSTTHRRSGFQPRSVADLMAMSLIAAGSRSYGGVQCVISLDPPMTDSSRRRRLDLVEPGDSSKGKAALVAVSGPCG